jgi:hypothetical protein
MWCGFEGVVVNTAFNLLKYPMQARQRRLRWRLGSGFAGGLIGLALGAGVLHWMRLDLDALAFERGMLQAQIARRQAQAGDDKVRRDALAMARRQQILLDQIQQHQQAWVRLHDAVLQEAGRSGWSLDRLQVTGDRLELQGRTHDPQALMAAQVRLSEKLQSPLALVSLVASPAEITDRHAADMVHVFVWQGPWLSLQPTAARRVP